MTPDAILARIAEAEQLIEEARRSQAETLDLSTSRFQPPLRQLPASLGNLQDLRTLILGREIDWLSVSFLLDSFSDLSPLATLRCLQNIVLANCDKVKDLSPLAELQSLQSLDLNHTGVKDLAPLAKLPHLQSLELSHTDVIDLTPLAKLQELQRLNLSWNALGRLALFQGLQGFECEGVTDLTPLAQLQKLQNLDLSFCGGVTDLAPLAKLKGLQTLVLSSTFIATLAPLAQLKELQMLGLAQTCVTDLTPLAKLQGLQDLSLRGTGVTDLAPLAKLQGLQCLDLSYCADVTDLSPLAYLKELQKLDLYGCRPTVPAALLRGFAGQPSLTRLTSDDAAGVPREVLSRDSVDNCLPRLRAYLSELNLGAEADTEVKVILLGNGRVGKTQLCQRFRGQPFDQSIKSTHGIQIWREELQIRSGSHQQAFQVSWWDFGGQDIYHGTHALFLQSRAVFLILWTPNLENRNEYREGRILLRNQPLVYWLDYVRTLAGEGSPVIVVQSQCDQLADRRPAPPRPAGFEFFECCSYSAKENLGRATLEVHLGEALRYLLERNGALAIGEGRAKVRRRLYAWRGEDQQLEPKARQHRTLTLEEFRSLCDEAGGITSWEHALDYFHHTGVVFYQRFLFSDRIVLDQDWALEGIYTVFDRERTAAWLKDSGRFTREDLALRVWREYSVEEQRLFLSLMESCGVCFSCGKNAVGEERYVAPDLLPKFTAVAGRLHAWKEETGTPVLRLVYRFFHPAIIRHLMSKIGGQAADHAEYWKYGFWLKDGWRDTQLLVHFQDISTSVAPGAGELELKAQGRDPLGLLMEIREQIRRLRIGEEPEELLTLDGVTVARSALDTVIAGHVLDLKKQPIPSAAFAAFWEILPGNRATSKDHEINIIPQPLTPEEKGQREVFISYAWGDDTPEGKIRARIVDELYSALANDGFLPMRDRDQARPGERISCFIRQLTRADLVVAVISDKYLRSSYCMYEIYRLWQKCQGDPDDLAQRLVPIVLPEVKIGDLRERAPLHGILG